MNAAILYEKPFSSNNYLPTRGQQDPAARAIVEKAENPNERSLAWKELICLFFFRGFKFAFNSEKFFSKGTVFEI